MSFTPVVRFRNFTVDNLKAILEVYPDMVTKISWEEAKTKANEVKSDYKRTAYQFACQMGIEDRGREPFRVHSYLYTFDDLNLEKYLIFWLKVYYAPNPYVNSGEDDSMLIYCEVAKAILEAENLTINYTDFFEQYIGGKSSDILLNAIKSFAHPIKYKREMGTDYLYIDVDSKSILENEVAFIEKEFPIIDANDKRVFFDRFSYKNFCKFHGIVVDLDTNKAEDENSNLNIQRKTGGTNVLFYGVPGSGKSYTIKTKYCSDSRFMERVVFHPDYTYSDFVGQILPRVVKEKDEDDGKVRYIFTPGPFTNILNKAENNPQDMYFLVIEELNRGNAPAIFGEIFQLLDRDENGTSEYGISNYDVALEVYGDEKHEVKLPSNLTILATMNTSDQNVFTLDTAFQRRWDMKLINNDINNAEHADTKILDTDITWRSFIETINKAVLENSMGLTSTEDKRLGAYYIKESDIAYNVNVNSSDIDEKKKALIQNSRFPEKVLKYLWDDVFKYNREEIFEEKYKSLEELIYDFEHEKRFGVFKLKFEKNTKEKTQGVVYESNEQE